MLLQQIQTYFNYVIPDTHCLVALDETGVYLLQETNQAEKAWESALPVVEALSLKREEYEVLAIGKGTSTEDVICFPPEELEVWVRALCGQRDLCFTKEGMEELAVCWEKTLAEVKIQRKEGIRWVDENWESTKLAKELVKFRNQCEDPESVLTEEQIKQLVEQGESAIHDFSPEVTAELRWILKNGYARESEYTIENLKFARKREWKTLLLVVLAGACILLNVPWWITCLFTLWVLHYANSLDSQLSRGARQMFQTMCLVLLLVLTWNPAILMCNTMIQVVQNILRMKVF